MDSSAFESKVEAIVESQGTEQFVFLALDELEVEYVEDVPEQHRCYFIARCIALWEEEQR